MPFHALHNQMNLELKDKFWIEGALRGKKTFKHDTKH